MEAIFSHSNYAVRVNFISKHKGPYVCVMYVCVISYFSQSNITLKSGTTGSSTCLKGEKGILYRAHFSYWEGTLYGKV